MSQEMQAKKTTDQGTYNLNIAASQDNFAEVQRLVTTQNVDVNSSDYDKRTPLHLACAEGFLQTTEILITLGANVNAVDRFNQTPLDEAVMNGHVDVALALRKAGGEHSSKDLLAAKLINAVAKNDLKTVRNLLDNNIDPNIFDYDRRTPLHLAVAERNEEMVNLLLDKKADHEFKDRHGVSPFDEAMSHQTRSGYDAVKEIFMARFPELKREHDEDGHNEMGAIVKVFGPIQVLMVILLAATTEYGFHEEHEKAHGGVNGTHALSEDFNYLSDVYGWFMDVHVMIFIGFGFLMTFLRKYNFGAVGLTFLIGAYSLQLHILVEGLVEYALHGHAIHINVKSLILGDFSAGAVLITYGVVLGKASAMQLMLVCTIETIFYTINETIGIQLGITDIGGSMVIHMFGAFFGLTLSYVMRGIWKDQDMKNNASVYHSDMFAMIGTVFLWMFWPSFNGVLGANDEMRHLAVVNTVLSLSGSCVTAFLASHYFRGGEFCMVDIQNATLAGGVAMGTSADLYGNPGVSVLIGCIAGFVSVVGYTKLQPHLEEKWGLHDTCGVNNLHGMPSIIGAVAGIIVLSSHGEENEFPVGNQALYILITLCMSIGGGAVTGLIVKGADPVEPSNLFQDKVVWEVPHEELPYFFDHRGEMVRDEHGGAATGGADKAALLVIKQRLDFLESKLASFQFSGRQLSAMVERTKNDPHQNPAR